MASGLPVAGLYAEGTVDLVTHLRTGLLLDVHPPAIYKSHIVWAPYFPLDPAAQVATYDSCAHLMRPSSRSFQVIAERYAALLELLISDHTMRADMGAAALSVAQEYSWQRCASQMLSTYLDAVHVHPTRTPPRHVASTSRKFLRGFVDALVVGLAIFIAGLSHVLYMIPTLADFST